MQKLRIRHGDWVIVCDGKKALVLENAGDEKFLNLKTKEVHGHPDPKTHELGTDAPGRAFSSVGTERSAMADRLAHAGRRQVLAQAYGPPRRGGEHGTGTITEHGRA